MPAFSRNTQLLPPSLFVLLHDLYHLQDTPWYEELECVYQAVTNWPELIRENLALAAR
ncbi:hypothetical protein JCM10207_008061, partial [Rhodosporidiobolus poonsookiae]